MGSLGFRVLGVWGSGLRGFRVIRHWSGASALFFGVGGGGGGSLMDFVLCFLGRGFCTFRAV